MDILWLGYNGLTVPYADVVAVLFYGTALDHVLVRSYGSVPPGIQAVVLTATGDYLPARWSPYQLRKRWAGWRYRDADES